MDDFLLEDEPLSGVDAEDYEPEETAEGGEKAAAEEPGEPDGEDLFTAEELDRLLAAEAPAPAAKAMPNAIPKGRFEEVNAKLKEEREVRARVEAELAALRSMDFRAKEKAALEAMDEGDYEKAAEIRAEIAQAAYLRAKDEAVKEIDGRAQAAALNALAEEIMTRSPHLDSDPVLMQQFRYHRDQAVNQGLPMAQALRFAEGEVNKLVAWKHGSGAGAQPEDKAKAEDPRGKAAFNRALADAKKQPPNLGGTGARATPPDKRRMPTEEEVEGMKEEDKWWAQ